MSDYGTHPTQYGNLNNDELYSMYRESVYSKLSENEKLDLLQETVNRDALERGELGSPRVQFEVMPANESGYAANGIISVNYDMAVNGVQLSEYNGQTIQHFIDDYNVQALNTVLHENAHCFQEQVIDGTIRIDDPQLTAEYQANDFTPSIVLENGSYKLGSQYLTGETQAGYHMYYFQATERDAYLSAEKKTDAILQGITEKHGTEPSFSAYAKSVAATGYQAREQEAIQLFQNPNFVKDLNQTLQNQYFGTNKPVDPATEKAVKAEMVESYRTMHQQISQGNHALIKEETKMSFDPKPVTMEEYDQTLRDTVNAYYTHAINDPSMSNEDALKSTGETAEKYLGATQEFQEAQNVQNAQTQINTGTENNAETVQNGAELTGSETEATVDNGPETSDSIEAGGGNTADPSVDSESIDGGEDCEDGLDI